MKEKFLRWKYFPVTVFFVFLLGLAITAANWHGIITAVANGGASPLRSHLFILSLVFSLPMLFFPLQCFSWWIGLKNKK